MVAFPMNRQATQPKFPLGQVLATPGAVEALRESGETPNKFLAKHVTGEWGDMSPDDKKLNDEDRSRHEIIDVAVKAYELSQDLNTKWFAADYAAKRRILEILCLNWKLDGVSLVPEWRRPFDLLAEGPLQKECRDGGI